MTTLEFTREGSKIALTPNGKAKSTKDGVTQEGSWTAVSSTEKNELNIKVGGQKSVIPVSYSFDHKAGNRNALKVEVPKDGESPAASAVFAGSIELDDEKDVTYRLPEGGAFLIYGKLSFDGAYTSLQIELVDGSKTSIRCSKPEIRQGVPGAPEKSTFLTVTAFSRIGQTGKELPARIGVFGNLVPKEQKIVFMGALKGDRTFDITIAGSGKLVNGALQISSDKGGQLSFAAAVRYQFDEGSGSWGVMLGYSDKKFKLTADLDFEKKKTGKDGETKLIGRATVEHDGGTGALSIELELEGQLEIGQNRALQFRLKGGIVNGKTSIDFSGKVTVDDKTISAEIKYAGEMLEIELAYSSEKIKSVISFLSDGKDVGIRFYVEYTFGANGDQKASEPKAA